MKRSHTSGFGTGFLLLLVGLLAVPVGLSLPEDMLGLLFGACVLLAAFIPIGTILSMALRTNRRDSQRLRKQAEHIAKTQNIIEPAVTNGSSSGASAQTPLVVATRRQWVIVDRDWAVTPQQNAYRTSIAHLEADRREYGVTRPLAPVVPALGDFYYEPQAGGGQASSSTAVKRRVQPMEGAQAGTPVREQRERSFTIGGQVRRTDVFHVVGE